VTPVADKGYKARKAQDLWRVGFVSRKAQDMGTGPTSTLRCRRRSVPDVLRTVLMSVEVACMGIGYWQGSCVMAICVSVRRAAGTVKVF